MSYFAQILVNGLLQSAIYALTALAFIIVYKASRTINFALAEFVMLATKLVTLGIHALGLGVVGDIGFGCAGMVGFAVGFNRLVLRRLVGRPVIALIMVTIGLGIFLQASAFLLFAGVPGLIPLSISQTPLALGFIMVWREEVAAALIATFCIATVHWFFHYSRTGVALRAAAEDPQAAMLAGIDLNHHIALSWALAGVICVIAGALWTVISGGGFSIAHLGFKVFPIVIIGGLDSLPGVLVGAVIIGVLENLASAYIDPHIAGFSTIAAYLMLIAVLFARP